ncbi:MAG: cation transporter [Lawsonibacter sp.]|nr:cation transporter [Lawsonibacter sp.]
MISFLVQHILPPGASPEDPEVRRRCGALSGGVGIFLNLLLCAVKGASAVLTGSVAMAADAVNNLSDAASSVVTLVGFRLAGQQADEGHPFGHGRMEYLTGLLVALAILLMGVEVGRSAAEKILRPQLPSFSWTAAALLAAAIGVKLWMFRFNRRLGRAIASPAMEAAAADSLSDAVSTAVVLASALAGHFTGARIDGFAGLLVAAFILKTGWEAVRDTADPLLGRPMAPELAGEIDRLVLEHPGILGIHDLVYHDYGPGRAMMSFHAEVPAQSTLTEVHTMIDHIERELKQRFRIETVIHMDPVDDGPRARSLRLQVEQLARDIDPSLTVHDLRTGDAGLSFDVMVPYRFRLTDLEVRRAMERRLEEQLPRCPVQIQIDHSYVRGRDA